MTNEKTLNKIRALLAKTIENGCTEAEAMTALEMARAMMDAYEVTEEDLAQTKTESAVKYNTREMRDPHNIKLRMAMSISKFTNTKCYASNNKKTVNYVGMKGDVDFAIWLLETLTAFVQKELKNYIWSNGYTRLRPSEKRYVINGFVAGCCNRINERIRAMIKKDISINSNALIVVKDELINRKMQELGLTLRIQRNRGSYQDYNASKHGREAGERASFGRPVETGGMLRLEQK